MILGNLPNHRHECSSRLGTIRVVTCVVCKDIAPIHWHGGAFQPMRNGTFFAVRATKHIVQDTSIIFAVRQALGDYRASIRTTLEHSGYAFDYTSASASAGVAVAAGEVVVVRSKVDIEIEFLIQTIGHASKKNDECNLFEHGWSVLAAESDLWMEIHGEVM